MRVAMYYPWVYLKGGIERTILELVRRSHHEWTIFTSHYRPDDTFPEFADVDIRQIGSISVKRDLVTVARACSQLLLRGGEWSDYDALMVNCDGIGNLLALRAHGLPLLCLCHTPLKVGYDDHARERWLRVQRPSLFTRAGVQAFKQADRLAWRRYRRVFCVSKEVERRLQAAGVVRPEQTEILHPAVDLDRFVPSGRREDYFLMPGRIMWSKNVELGLRAFLRFQAASPGDAKRLVIAGAVDDKSRPYLAQLRELATGRSGIEFVENPSDEQLLDLYDRSLAVLFTPPNEDWGIVPLEAMAFGKPVIAVDRGGPAESIVDRESGLLCRDDPDAFAAAMRLIATDEELYEHLASGARARVLRYDWNGFVGRIDEYLDELHKESVHKEKLALEDAHRV